MNNPYIKDFPILSEKSNAKRLVYLDNAATTQKPIQVLNAIDDYYRKTNANPHRGAYSLSIKSTEAYENTRTKVKEFINAAKDAEIVFTKSATEALNLLALSYGMNFIEKDDEILISIAEHHSNLVPWQQVASIKGAKLHYLYIDENGEIPLAEIENKITEKTKIISIAHVSNVLGVINPIEKIVEKAHSKGAIVILDMAQSIPHMKIDVQKMDIDFAVFSGHKMYAPMGIGVLYGKESLLEKTPPFLFGGDMIEYVFEQSATFAPVPQKFEGGTQNVEGAVGLSAAIDYMNSIGFENISSIESKLTAYALEKLLENPHIEILGSKSSENRSGVIAFNVKDVHPHDVSSILDADGIAIRSGHHCAHPLMKYLGINASCRLSLSFYNTEEDIDILSESLKNVRRWLRIES
jgi:cysteine desulfurase/selenocysteine lyase